MAGILRLSVPGTAPGAAVFSGTVAIAGDFTNAAVFMIEQGHGNPCLAGSWANWGANLGVALGALVTALVSLPMMPDWAWRIPFLLSCVTSLLALMIRRRLQESPVFDAAEAQSLTPVNVLRELISQHKCSSLAVIPVSACAGVTLYVGNMFWCSYVINHGYFSPSQANVIASLDMGVEFIALPLMAILAYRFGIRKVMVAGLLVTVVGAGLNFYWAEQGSVLTSMLTMTVFALGIATFEAPMFKFLFDFFPARIRCTGIALAWTVGGLFSTASPLLAQRINDHYGWLGGVSCILLVCTCALIALLIRARPPAEQSAVTIEIASP